MDCNHARLLLTFARERAALDSGEADTLEHHLNHCPDCAVLAASEERLDTALGRAMRDVPVPAGLKSRLLARLPRPRRLRRWVVSGLAAAAVLLLAAGVSWRLWFAPLPEIAFDDEPVYICKYAKGQVTAKFVEQWFEERGLHMAFPAMDVQKLDSFSIGYWQGRKVPKLEFLADGHIAHVYVLSAQQFEIPVNVQPPSHRRTTDTRSLELLPGDGYVYVILYSGGGLAAFLPAFQ